MTDFSKTLSSSGAIANARWADPDYIADKYFYDPEQGDIWIGRNPHNFDSAIGYSDERHIMVCAGAGSGKGRSFIVNNLALYPGSTITYDPKGELPYILAPRRGSGNHLCDGMGQKVFVLDPLKRSGVSDEYLGYCDPVSMLDPKDPELSTWCFRLARSLVKEKKSEQGSDWAEKGIAFSALVIEHVVTSREIPKKDKNLHYVLQLILEGNVAGAERVNKILATKAEKEAHTRSPTVTPYDVLLRDIAMNKDANRYLAMEARKLERESKTVPKYFAHVSGEAAEGLRWLRSASMESVLQGWGDESRCFDPRKLKTEKISLFIVLPVDDLDLYEPWLQSLFIGIFAAMRETKIKAKLPVLCFLDEFSSLGYQDYIATSLDNIRGAGMKLVFIVQNYGTLKHLYGEKIESFFTNSGLELYFGRIGQIATDYLKNELGETEVVRIARSQNFSQTDSYNRSNAVSFGEVNTQGGSETNTEGSNYSRTAGQNFNWSNAVNWSDSRNWGQTHGSSMGRNYGPHVFFEGFEHTNSYGTNLNKNHGGSHSKGRTENQGGGHSESNTKGFNRSRALGSSWSNSTSKTETETVGTAKAYQIGGGVAETFHKKPLLEGHEINSYLRSIPNSDCDHPAYPGMMLVRIAGEEPFFVRRSNYDQDPYFERCFSEDPLHKFLPLNDQPLLGYQYTPEHIVTFSLPELLRLNGYKALPRVRPHQKIDMGLSLFSFSAPTGQETEVRSPIGGRVMTLADEEGAIVTMKTLSVVPEVERARFENAVFAAAVNTTRENIANAEMEQRRIEEHQRQIEERRLKELEEQKRLKREKQEQERIEAKKQAAIKKAIKVSIVVIPILSFVTWCALRPSLPDSQGSFSGKVIKTGVESDSIHIAVFENNFFSPDVNYYGQIWGLKLKAGSTLGSRFQFPSYSGEVKCKWFSKAFHPGHKVEIYKLRCVDKEKSRGGDIRSLALQKYPSLFVDHPAEHGGWYDK